MVCRDTSGGCSRPRYYKDLAAAVQALDSLHKHAHPTPATKVAGFLTWCIIGAAAATLVLGLASLPLWVLVAAWVISRL